MELTRKEFEELVQKEGYEVYTSKQVEKFCSDILKSTDTKIKENGAIDFASLTKVTVRENDLSKSIMFYRPASVEWKDVEDPETLMKSRQGYYKDTPANRKKGIVGKPYGDVKATQYEEAPRSNTISRLKADYAAASKKGDKVAMAKISKQIEELSKKEKGGIEKEKKED